MAMVMDANVGAVVMCPVGKGKIIGEEGLGWVKLELEWRHTDPSPSGASRFFICKVDELREPTENDVKPTRAFRDMGSRGEFPNWKHRQGGW